MHAEHGGGFGTGVVHAAEEAGGEPRGQDVLLGEDIRIDSGLFNCIQCQPIC